MPAASASPPPRPRRRSLFDDDDKSSRPKDGARDRHRRRRDSRSPDQDRDARRKHHRSRRHRDDDDGSAGASDEERSARRRGRDRSRSRSRSRHRHHRSRSKDAARDRYEKKRRYDDVRSRSPRRHHRSDRRKDRDESPRHSRRSRHDRHDHHSRSPSPKRRRPSASASPPRKRSNKPLPSQEAAYRGGAGEGSAEGAEQPVEKQKPNFKQTGLLAREANTVTVGGTAVVLKYNEPPDARKPPARDEWRLFVFKGQNCLQTIELGSRSCWLIGREAAVADLLVEHPSTSKQHAVLQFRYTTRVNEYGDKDARVRPYLIDLESSNGTILNGDRIEPARYVEFMDKDVMKIGHSEREYVLMLPPK